MTLREIPIYFSWVYWSKLCKVKSFDLSKKSHRLLIICFWLIVISSATSLIIIVQSHSAKIGEFNKNKEILDNFEANFALDRFFEDCAEDVKILQNELTSDYGLIDAFFPQEKIPQGYSKTDIHNLVNKLSNQFILQDGDVQYERQELELIVDLYKQLTKSNDDPPFFDLLNQSWWNAHSVLWVLSNWMDIDWRTSALRQNEYIMAKASLAISEWGCCYHWGPDSTAYSDYYRNNDPLESLSNEEALSISQNLPFEYSLDAYSIKYESTDFGNRGVNYYPNFLIEPFEQISFFNPQGFNPYDVKHNLENFRLALGNSNDIHFNSILKILIIVFLNILFVFTIRLINWVNNG